MTATLVDPARPPQTLKELRPLLASRRWQWQQVPFPHVTATQVFTPEVYEQLATDFRAVMESVQGKHYNRQHDFFGSSLLPGQCRSLELFVSPAWFELFAALFGVRGAGYLTAGIHRHQPGSRNGFPHNDIYPENLRARRNDPDVLPLGRPTSGKAVRAVAILFYLNNGPWTPGDGGETSLYRDWKDPVDEPVDSVPPRGNTLLAFGCHPHSYHSFRSNAKRRDSVISFVYRSVEDYQQLWGAEGLQQYADYRRHRV